MERESFKDEQVAEVLNRHYVSIKVDREERPDIDHIYMASCHAMTGQGGWPLTVIMTPDQKPFFTGTYFPKHSKWGRPGLIELLELIAEKWQQDPDALVSAAASVARHVQQSPTSESKSNRTLEQMVQQAYQMFEDSFDEKHGGFGQSPKFPTPHNIVFLLRYGQHTNNPKAQAMVEKTLQAMYRGGIYDHVGFGFARYSTDEKWLVPHFEKMLYDNALLAWAYLETYQATGNDFYATVAKQIFTYVLRDMTSPQGGFYSAEDADSEGVEGKFYVWSLAELERVLGPSRAKIYSQVYDITQQGNFEGYNIPNLIQGNLEEKAASFGMTTLELLQTLEQCRVQLFNHREKRIHPHKDDKVLTAWNGLMMAALAKGAILLDHADYLQAAKRSLQFIQHHLFDQQGRLLARYRAGEAAFNAYLDDYAFLIWGLLELYQASFKPDYLSLAITLNTQVQSLFADETGGGFYFYGSDAEQLWARPKEFYDGAMPSGNAVMALNLLRLAAITGDDQLNQMAEKHTATMANLIGDYPLGHAYFLIAAVFSLNPITKVIIAGKLGDPKTKSMLQQVQRSHQPNMVTIYRNTGAPNGLIEKIIPATREQAALQDQATAYVCRDLACHEPVQDVEALQKLLPKG